MNKCMKALLSALTIMLAAAALTVTACAEDYVFEITEPYATSGEWDLAFTYETANAKNFPDNFNALCMTPESEVIVEYTYEGKCPGSPLELIWQTWNGPVEPNPDVKKSWNRIEPYEYSETSAKFSFEDIAAAYGTEDFSTVYSINVGDKGVKLTVTGITVTNCNINGGESETRLSVTQTQSETETQTEQETEAVTSAEAERETVRETAPVSETSAEADTVPTESEPTEKGGGAAAAAAAVFVITAVTAAAVFISRKRKKKNRYY